MRPSHPEDSPEKVRSPENSWSSSRTCRPTSSQSPLGIPRRKDWNNSKNCKAFGIQIPFKISFEIQIPIGLDDLKTRYIYPLSSDKVLSFPKILGAFEARFPSLICILLTSFDLQLVVRLIQFPLRPGPSVQITDRIGVSPGIMGLRREATVGLHVPLGTCYLGMGSSRKANWIGNSCFDNFVFNPKIRLLALNDFYMHNLFPLHTSHQSRLVTLVLPCAMNMFAIMVRKGGKNSRTEFSGCSSIQVPPRAVVNMISKHVLSFMHVPACAEIEIVSIWKIPPSQKINHWNEPCRELLSSVNPLLVVIFWGTHDKVLWFIGFGKDPTCHLVGAVNARVPLVSNACTWGPTRSTLVNCTPTGTFDGIGSEERRSGADQSVDAQPRQTVVGRG